MSDVVKFFAQFLVIAACLPGALAHAAPVKVALLTGDAQSAAAIGAITELRRDPALKDITVRSFPRTELSDADRQFVRESDIIIGYTRYGALLRALAPEIRAAADRGSFVAGVGGTLDPEFADFGFQTRCRARRVFRRWRSGESWCRWFAPRSRVNIFPALKFAPPSVFPEIGFFDPASRRAFTRFEDYSAAYLTGKPERREPSVDWRLFLARHGHFRPDRIALRHQRRIGSARIQRLVRLRLSARRRVAGFISGNKRPQPR